MSVVLPTHNRQALLAEAIKSVVNQDFDDWEAIIVDDASSPPATVPTDSRIRVIRHETNRGGAAAKNSGVVTTKGKIVAFLDDDDLFAPSYLARAVEVLEIYPKLDVVFMGVHWFGSRGGAGQSAYDQAMASLLPKIQGTSLEPGLLTFQRKLLFSGLLNSVPMAFQRPVVRRSSFERIGLYQSEILLWDCDWALRAGLLAQCALITDGLYLQRAEGQGYSSQHARRKEQAESNRLMKERLLINATEPFIRRAITSSLARYWFDSAWGHYQRGEKSKALRCCLKSLRLEPRVSRGKLLLRLMLSRSPDTLR